MLKIDKLMRKRSVIDDIVGHVKVFNLPIDFIKSRKSRLKLHQVGQYDLWFKVLFRQNLLTRIENEK